MERFRPYLLPAVAALVLLVYFVWRATSDADSDADGASPAATSEAPPSKAGGQ